MMSQFVNETSLKRESKNSWTGVLNDNWNIGDVPNGGYLLAVVLRAMKEEVGSENLLSANAHYLRPGSANNEARVDLDVLREGNNISTYSGSLTQNGKLSLQVLAAFGEVENVDDQIPQIKSEAPVLPPPDACRKRSSESQGIQLPIQQRVDVRIAELETDSERAELYGWIKFCDSSPVDSLALALFSDAFPPSIFSKLGRVGWVPTVELTVQVRSTPVEGWIMGHFFTDDLQNGTMVETGSLWDSEGSLVAQSRQLALIRSDSKG
ncbi:MAG: thioesterase family protein [Acidimicrobiales bacterium]|nr:thioesterase family protein [Acidimicrobiales bacterium]